MTDSIRAFLLAVPTWPPYWWVLVFFAFYPILSAIMWVTTGVFFYMRREHDGGATPEQPPLLARYPSATVLIPAFCEEKHIAESLACACAIDYPDFEVVVVDDASTDGTREAVRPFVSLLLGLDEAIAGFERSRARDVSKVVLRPTPIV